MTRDLRAVAVFALLGVVASSAAVWLQFQSLRPPIPVGLATADLGPVRAVARALQPVSIRSCQTRLISASATPSSRISRLIVREGQLVSTGEPLLQLADPALMADLVAARQLLADRRSEAASACGNASESRRTPRRLEPLLRKRVDEAGHADHRSMDGGQTGNSACLAATLAQRQAMVRYRAAGDAMAALTIRSPISGLVTELTAAAGEAPGPAPLMRIADMSCLRLRASLPAAARSRLSNGMPVCVAGRDPAAPPDCTARLQHVASASGGEQTTIEVALTGVPAGTHLGDPLDVSVPLGDADDVVRIPLPAIIGDTNNSFVWKLEAGRVRRHPIERGLDDGVYAEVTAGLMPGERVAIPSADTVLQDGVQVEPIETPVTH